MNELSVMTGDGFSDLLSGITPLKATDVPNAVRAFHGAGFLQRQILLALQDRNAHGAIGLSWDKFCVDHLGMADNGYCRQMIVWARVERQIFGTALLVATNKENLKNTTRLTQSTAFELAKLSPDEQPIAWREVKAMEHSGTHLPKQITRAIKDIVARRLNRAGIRAGAEIEHGVPQDADPIIAPSPYVPDLRPATAPVEVKPRLQPAAPVQPPRKPVDFTPVVPPIYDRGPEFDEPEDSELAEADAKTDAVLCEALAFMRQFIAAYKQSDRNAFDELFRDAMRFVKEYGA